MTPPPRHSELCVLGEQRRELHAKHPEDCRRRRSRKQVTQNHRNGRVAEETELGFPTLGCPHPSFHRCYRVGRLTRFRKKVLSCVNFRGKCKTRGFCGINGNALCNISQQIKKMEMEGIL